MKYWQHDETGRLCESEARPSERWDEITKAQYMQDPRNTTTASTPRKHNPAWKDNTRTARSAKRTKADDDWAAKISSGRYTTLRRLMTAIHNGEFHLIQADFIPTKKGKQS